MDTPLSLMIETKEWRSSRGVQSSPIPAARVMERSDRRTLPAARGVPTLVQKTRPWSRHSAAAAARSAVCRVWSFRSAAAAWSGSFSVRRDFSVFVFPALPDRTPDVDRELLVAEADVSDWPPGQLREQLVPLPTARRVDVAARFRPGDLTSPAGGAKSGDGHHGAPP